MPTTRTDQNDIPVTYQGLLGLHMLKPIHDEVGYANACEVIDRLSGLDLNPDQEEYLEALSIMVEDYEASLDLAVNAGASPLEALRYLCGENGLSGAGVAEILGVSRTLGVKLLAGERKLTLAHAGKLAERFKVSVALFVGE